VKKIHTLRLLGIFEIFIAIRIKLAGGLDYLRLKAYPRTFIFTWR